MPTMAIKKKNIFTYFSSQVHHYKKQSLQKREHVFVNPFLCESFKHELNRNASSQFGVPGAFVTQRAHPFRQIFNQRQSASLQKDSIIVKILLGIFCELFTISLLPNNVVAVPTISISARLPGLHSSFSSWPMMTASASTSTKGSNATCSFGLKIKKS